MTTENTITELKEFIRIQCMGIHPLFEKDVMKETLWRIERLEESMNGEVIRFSEETA